MTKQALEAQVKAEIVETVYSGSGEYSGEFRLVPEDAYFCGVWDLPGRGGRVTKNAAKELCKKYGYKLVSKIVVTRSIPNGRRVVKIISLKEN